MAVTFGAFDQGGVDGGALAGSFADDKYPVLLSHGRGPAAVFDELVVDLPAGLERVWQTISALLRFHLAVVEEERESFPERQGVVDGAAELPHGQDMRVLAQGEQFSLRISRTGADC